MKKEVIAIIADAAIHFTVSQTVLAQQITIDLPKFPTIGNPTPKSTAAGRRFPEDRISDTNERMRIEPAWRSAFFGNPLTEFGVQ